MTFEEFEKHIDVSQNDQLVKLRVCIGRHVAKTDVFFYEKLGQMVDLGRLEDEAIKTAYLTRAKQGLQKRFIAAQAQKTAKLKVYLSEFNSATIGTPDEDAVIGNIEFEIEETFLLKKYLLPIFRSITLLQPLYPIPATLHSHPLRLSHAKPH